MISAAIWGYGPHGKNIRRLVERFSPDRYRITAVMDRNAAAAEADDVPGGQIFDPARVRELYRTGLFEGVIIGTWNENASAQIRAELDAAGVPVLEPEEPVYEPAPAFPQAREAALSAAQEGYDYCVLSGVFGAVLDIRDMMLLYRGDGAVLDDLWRYGDQQKSEIRWLRVDPAGPAFANVREMPGDWCIPANYYSDNYWHFTFEVMDQIEILEEAGFTGTYILPPVPFAAPLAELFGLAPERILWTDAMDHAGAYRFERVHFLKNRGASQKSSAPVLRRMADRILRRLDEKDAAAGAAHTDPRTGGPYPKRVYVKRIGTRRLLGADELLDEYGFTTIIPEELSVEEQIRYFREADVILYAHGANAANSIYMRPGAVVVEVFPRVLYNPSTADALLAGGIHWLPVIQAPIVGFLQQMTLREIGADFSVDRTLLAHALENAVRLSP
ncbi:MAG: glycosyltransferase family 61 protein [Lachnospiraceae bacterium]|nr:glycosyltransferase family 61 protein [Lachnospiraceae bacterium]